MRADPSDSSSRGLRPKALLAVGLLACTTVRTPVSTIDDHVALRSGRPEPQVELWVESDRPLSLAEAARARAEAEAALDEALLGRAEPGGNALLVVRAQGVTRTAGHRRDQAAATAGIVVGAVAVVAAVVVSIVAGGKGGGSSSIHGMKGVAAAGHAAGKLPRAFGEGARFAHVPSRPVVLPPHRFPSAPFPGKGTRPPRAGTPVNLDLGFNWALPLDQPEDPCPSPFVCGLEVAPTEVEPEPARAGAWEEEASRADLFVLDPPPRLAVEDRGFFDGDRLLLEAVLLDPATGEALWVKRVGTKADPRDARAVRAAVDRLLLPEGWLPPSPPGG